MVNEKKYKHTQNSWRCNDTLESWECGEGVYIAVHHIHDIDDEAEKRASIVLPIAELDNYIEFLQEIRDKHTS